MPKLSLSILWLAAVPVFGQLESHTVTISATQSINLQPDQVVFGITVNSGATASLDQIVGALAGLGVSSADLIGVSDASSIPVQWSFALTAPLASLSTTIASLTKLQQSIVQNNSGLTLTFTVNGTQVSPQRQQSESCANSDRIADATAQAQKLAAAAGLTLGPIVKVSNATSLEPAQVNVVNGAAVARLGVFISGAFSEFLLGAPALPVTCSLLVKFQLLP
jgi:hypothetical protein